MFLSGPYGEYPTLRFQLVTEDRSNILLPLTRDRHRDGGSASDDAGGGLAVVAVDAGGLDASSAAGAGPKASGGTSCTETCVTTLTAG